jgi:DNA-binding transcriptional ArsR family regulator
MQEELVLETPAQVGALAHPLRLQILTLLHDEPRTNQQMAQALGQPPARLHFHVRELATAGLITLVAERPKGGVIEKYYRAAARYFRLAPSLTTGTPQQHDMARVTWEAVQHSLLHAIDSYGGPPPQLRSALNQHRLSPDAMGRVREHLLAIDEEFLAAARAPETADGVGVSLGYLFHEAPPRE